MEEIVTILSTREWAITIWGTGFFIWMLTQSEIRKSLWNVIKILLGKNLRRFFLIIALYVAGITMIFYQLPFWNNIYLKDIILWLIFSGISYCVNSIIKGDTEHLKSTVKDNFRVIVIFEYFIGTFTFKFSINFVYADKGERSPAFDYKPVLKTTVITINTSHKFYTSFLSKIYSNAEVKTTFELFLASLIQSVRKTDPYQAVQNDRLMTTWYNRLNNYIAEQLNPRDMK